MAAAIILPAQENPLSTHSKAIYTSVKNNVTRAAEKMPEENYSFKPVEDVRTFGQLIGHIADAQNNACAAAMGEKNPTPGIEKSKTSRSDLIAALKASYDLCDKAYAALTDATAVQPVQARGNRPQLIVLDANTSHSNEHYGNIVTYMRIKGLVPPSSEKR